MEAFITTTIQGHFHAKWIIYSEHIPPPNTYVACMLCCNKNILAIKIIKDYFEKFSVIN